MNRYVHTVRKADGRVFNYFRPGNVLKRDRFPSLRLSDDLEKAEREAATLAKLRPELGNASLYDHLAVLMKEGRRRAKVREIDFHITEAQARAILRAQDHRCAITGLPFDFEHRGESGQAWRRPFAPSLDRIDHRHGYSAKNVRIVLYAVNAAMNEWGLETFMTIARAAVARSEGEHPLETVLPVNGNRVDGND